MVLGVGGSNPLTHPIRALLRARSGCSTAGVLDPARASVYPFSPVDLSIPNLFAFEPRLADLERDVDEARDDGTSSWYCSNFVWLPLNTRLRLLVGVARLPQPGDEEHPELYESRAYERVFEFLSRRLPACRNCGCRRFLALRTASP